jgi:hypothetical protein
MSPHHFYLGSVQSKGRVEVVDSQTDSTGNIYSGWTFSISLPMTTGNRIVAVIGTNSNGGHPQLSEVCFGTGSTTDDLEYISDSFQRQSLYCAHQCYISDPLDGSESSNLYLGRGSISSTADVAVVLIEVKNVHATTPVEYVQTGSGYGSTASAGAGLTAGANDLILSCTSIRNGYNRSITGIDSSFVEVDQVASPGTGSYIVRTFVAEKDGDGTTSEDPDISISGSTDWVVTNLSLQVA